eukprot:gene555-45928_t
MRAREIEFSDSGGAAWTAQSRWTDLQISTELERRERDMRTAPGAAAGSGASFLNEAVLLLCEERGYEANRRVQTTKDPRLRKKLEAYHRVLADVAAGRDTKEGEGERQREKHLMRAMLVCNENVAEGWANGTLVRVMRWSTGGEYEDVREKHGRRKDEAGPVVGADVSNLTVR